MPENGEPSPGPTNSNTQNNNQDSAEEFLARLQYGPYANPTPGPSGINHQQGGSRVLVLKFSFSVFRFHFFRFQNEGRIQQNIHSFSSSSSESESESESEEGGRESFHNRARGFYQQRNHKRRRIEFQQMNPGEDVSNPPSPYSVSPPSSPPPSSESNADHSVIFRNQSFVANLRQVGHRRNTRFSLSDHLYDLRIVPRDHRQVLLTDLFPLLHQSISTALDRLREIYDNDFRRQVYVTVIDRSCERGLNSGNYNLNTGSDIISNHVLNMIEAYLQSNLSLRLNDSFHIKFKILSVEHFDHNIANNPDLYPHFPGKSSTEDFPPYICNVSEYCELHEKACFENMCTIVHAMIGIAQLDFLESQTDTFCNLKKKKL